MGTSNFKTILTVIFGICIVVGLALFALQKAGSGTSTAHLTVWGTIPEEDFAAALKGSSIAKSKTILTTYVKKDPSTFENDFVQALADGNGPDVVILRDDQLYKEHNRLFTIPYANYSQRTFKDTFIEGGEVNMAADGTVALPFMIDPLVMYWNRDLFSGSLIAQPPKYWDEFYDSSTNAGLISVMTKKDNLGTVSQSALALGGWNNITNAKEILSMLLMQAGTPITQRTNSGVASVLNSQFNYAVQPSSAAVNFYTQFSNPTSPAYTWNRSLPDSQTFFLAGNLATYLGFASEIYSIQQKNPNLNFDVTYVPQIRKAAKETVFAHLYSLAIVKQSQQIAPAFTAIVALTEAGSLSSLNKATNLPPVRRDLLASKPTDAFALVFYNSALIAHTWIDPDADATTGIFRDMIEGITSGRLRTSEALSRANESLGLLLK